MLIHRGGLANPMDKFAREMKKVSGKRKKVDADYEELSRLGFLGSLYMGETGPIMPAENIEACLCDSGKKERKGKDCKAGLFCSEHVPIEYDGPKEAEELWKDESFRNISGVVVQRARVFRTRPIFKEWSLTVPLEYFDELFNEEDVLNIAIRAGQIIGLGDWRPKHGRFRVEKIE